MEFIFRKVNEKEVDDIWDMILKRIDWMNEQGLQGWNTTGYLESYPISYYHQQQKSGKLYGLYDGNTKEIVSAGVLYEEDVRWGSTSDSFFLHNFVSNQRIKGAGTAFIKAAEQYAKDVGKEYMRLDSSKDNVKLTAYYEALGYYPTGECKDGLYEGILREKKLKCA